MKIKHQLTITVNEDDTVEYEFTGADGWAVGKMHRQLTRAVRHLKAEHRKISAEQQKNQAAAAAKQAEDDAVQKALDLEAETLGKRTRNAVRAGDPKLADLLKKQLNKLQNEGEENANDTGTDGSAARNASEGLGDSNDGPDESDGEPE